MIFYFILNSNALGLNDEANRRMSNDYEQVGSRIKSNQVSQFYLKQQFPHWLFEGRRH
jgi:hypothetical protein